MTVTSSRTTARRLWSGLALAVLATAVGTVFAPAVTAAPPYDAAVSINSGGGDEPGAGLAITYGSGQLQVMRNNQFMMAGNGELPTSTPNPSLHNGIYLAVGDTVVGPVHGEGPVGRTTAPQVTVQQWETVSAALASSTPDGRSGQIRSTLTATVGGLTYSVDYTIGYIYPNDYLSEAISVTIPSSHPATSTVRLYRGAELYLGGIGELIGYQQDSGPQVVAAYGRVDSGYGAFRSAGRTWSGYFSGPVGHLFDGDHPSGDDTIGDARNLSNTVTIPPTATRAIGVGWNLGNAAGIETMTNEVVFTSTPVLTASLSPPVVAPGSPATLTLTLERPATGAFETLYGGYHFRVVYPAGLVNVDGFTSNCAGERYVPLGGGHAELVNGSFPFGQQSCTFTLPVVAADPGVYTIDDDNLVQQINVANGLGSGVTLSVPPQPQLTVGFDPDTIQTGQTSTLTFTLSRPDATGSVHNIHFQADLPEGLTIATGSSGTDCGDAVLTAATGERTIVVDQASLARGEQTCTVTVPVTAATAGTYRIEPGDLSNLVWVVSAVPDEGVALVVTAPAATLPVTGGGPVGLVGIGLTLLGVGVAVYVTTARRRRSNGLAAAS